MTRKNIFEKIFSVNAFFDDFDYRGNNLQAGFFYKKIFPKNIYLSGIPISMPRKVKIRPRVKSLNSSVAAQLNLALARGIIKLS